MLNVLGFILTSFGLLLTALGAYLGWRAIQMGRATDDVLEGQRVATASIALGQMTDAAQRLDDAASAGDKVRVRIALHSLGHAAAALHAVDPKELSRLLNDDFFANAMAVASNALGPVKAPAARLEFQSLIPVERLDADAQSKRAALSGGWTSGKTSTP